MRGEAKERTRVMVDELNIVIPTGAESGGRVSAGSLARPRFHETTSNVVSAFLSHPSRSSLFVGVVSRAPL
jgi:hypothetical protein